MAMLNVSALITGYDTVGDHTEFIVEISCNGGLWRISRRFSDFDQLHSRLVRRFGDLIEVSLPEKQWFGRCVRVGVVTLEFRDERGSGGCMVKRKRGDVL
ncbi:hypothetical protein PHPALM_28480 [Phytophthora palmivora]|uniref:PX domain-containing protein n=1 Tax=Phytophthora palmivora TaxID=4796 RepID=A0A2P4XA30_9STRA|nr:hypothetical protein PHPALM_28480 [Phytophthora palmivora]